MFFNSFALVFGSSLLFTKVFALECAELYGQCGGINWTGPTCCPSGSSCQTNSDNPYYSQCVLNENFKNATSSVSSLSSSSMTAIPEQSTIADKQNDNSSYAFAYEGSSHLSASASISVSPATSVIASTVVSTDSNSLVQTNIVYTTLVEYYTVTIVPTSIASSDDLTPSAVAKGLDVTETTTITETSTVDMTVDVTTTATVKYSTAIVTSKSNSTLSNTPSSSSLIYSSLSPSASTSTELSYSSYNGSDPNYTSAQSSGAMEMPSWISYLF